MEPDHPKFHHPYEPYSIQLDFMQKLYKCIEDGNIGIFESPTGTGKSLSLICAAITWLRNNETRKFRDTFRPADPNGDWLAQAESENDRRELIAERINLEQKLQEVRKKEASVRSKTDYRPSKKARSSDHFDEDDFVLDDYHSDSDATVHRNRDDTLSSATRALLERLRPSTTAVTDEQQNDKTKVIFCSRTHSQLTQLVNELRKVEFPPGLSPGESTELHEVVKHVSLGSRKNLCINPKVVRLASSTAINEQCLDLQKPETPRAKRCEFLPSQNSREDQARIDAFKQNTIADIRDIEDIAALGRRMKLCPYYATRSTVPAAEIVTLPYPLLLQESAREAMGISVTGNIVIIDEAHNLMDAIAETVSVKVKLKHLEIARKQLLRYCQRFKNKLKGKNRVYITQVLKILGACIACMQAQSTKAELQSTISAHNILADAGVDQIQPHKLLTYLRESKLVYKVEGYAELLNENPNSPLVRAGDRNDSGEPSGSLAEVQNLLVVLTNPSSEGSFYIAKEDNTVTMKYTLLAPEEHFRDIVQQARTVILAGGTMSPMSDFSDRLFSYVSVDKIRTYSFGHVIDRTNLLVEPVEKGPTSVDMDFTWTKREGTALMTELGRIVEMVCAKTPDGTVVFFSSYDYLSSVVRSWKSLPRGQSTWETLMAYKQIFEEKKGVAVDELLQEYAKAIDTGKGALMLAVVGGKLSEGINFSDKLGRAVICVGLPFPNIQSAEWKAKVKHIEENEFEKQNNLGESEQICRARSWAAGKKFTDNTTMRAVNQSIGRAIRHRGDYAAILLVDKRFTTSRIQSKLPNWMRTGLQPVAKDWASIEKSYVDFFRRLDGT